MAMAMVMVMVMGTGYILDDKKTELLKVKTAWSKIRNLLTKKSSDLD